jgi:acyl carrier protein
MTTRSSEATATRDKTFRVVRKHLSFLRAEDPLPPEKSLRELGLDSLAAIDLLLDLEQTFGVVFPDEELTEETFRTAANIAAAVERLTRSAKER